MGSLHSTEMSSCLRISLSPATKLGQGYIFTGMCDSVHRGCLVPGGVCSRGECLVPGGCLAPEGVPGPGTGGDPPETATAAGGTHPTGMHSCYKCISPLCYHLCSILL